MEEAGLRVSAEARQEKPLTALPEPGGFIASKFSGVNAKSAEAGEAFAISR